MSEQNTKDIEELQARITFQEDTINSLNQLVATLGQEVQDMHKQLHLLYKKMDDVVYQLEQGQAGVAGSVDEKPPHY